MLNHIISFVFFSLCILQQAFCRSLIELQYLLLSNYELLLSNHNVFIYDGFQETPDSFHNYALNKRTRRF